MARFTYKGSFKAALLHEELIAALGVVPGLESGPDGSQVTVSVPAGVAQAEVDAVVAAHDPTQESAAEAAAKARQARRARLRAALEGGGLDALSEDIVRALLEGV